VKKTVGAISAELALKDPISTDPVELQREMTENYLGDLLATVESFREKTNGDFFVVGITKNEKLMPNVFRNYFVPRYTCPTPDYDQAVYKFNAKDENIEFIWVIPSKDACIHLKENAMYVIDEEKQLLQYVFDFADGTLFELSKKLNNESQHSPLLQE